MIRGKILPLIADFKRNPIRSFTYDLEQSRPKECDLKYFVLKDPRESRFKSQGASKIVEMWSNGSKNLFTGLVQVKGTENVYFGNRAESSGKKSLMCFIFLSESEIQVHYFKNFCPRSQKRQSEYLLTYCKALITAPR